MTHPKRDAARYNEAMTSSPLVKRPDMLDHRKVVLTTRAMSAIYRCPMCSRVEMIPFDRLGRSVETACRRGRVVVVQKIAEHDG